MGKRGRSIRQIGPCPETATGTGVCKQYRRESVKKTTPITLTALLIMLVLTLASYPFNAFCENDDVAKKGGVLKAAYASDPHSLDIHKELSTTANDTGRHIFESLYTYGDNYTLKKLLATSHEVSKDSLTHTIKVRQGVVFHNGSALTAEDVAASFDRWIKVAPLRPEIALFVESVETPDSTTVVFKLKEPYADFLYNMTFGVMPKAITEKYPRKTIADSDVIGSGPYRLKNREPDRFVELVRNEKYATPGTPGGEEHPGRSIHAYMDRLIINIVPDPTVRLLGMETGQYHYMESANYHDYNRIKKNPGLHADSLKGAMLYFLMNCKEGPTANLGVRKAIQAAVHCEPILKAAFTYPELYTLNGSWMSPKSRWYTESGTNLYNQNDSTKAKTFLKESGYDGSPIVVLTLGEIDYLRNSVIVLEAQLRQAGLNVDLQFVDQGALVPRMMNPKRWQIVYLIQPSVPVPTMMPWTKKTVSLGWWTGDEKENLAQQIRTQLDPETRLKTWSQMQTLCYNDAARVKIGDASTLTVSFAKIEGIMRKAGLGTRFWNARFK